MRSAFGVLMVLALSASAECKLFVQDQIKYGLERDDYLHRWYDRPLYQDSSIPKANNERVNSESWRRTAAVLREFGFDGISFFTASSGRMDVLGPSASPGGESELLFIIAGYHGEEKTHGIIDAGAKQPNLFRHGGKKVLLLRGEKGLSAEPGFIERVRRYAEEKHPGMFSLVATIDPFVKYDLVSGKLFDEAAERARGKLREVLRVADGIYLMEHRTVVDRRYAGELFDREVIPLVRGVLDEPEFRSGKILGCYVTAGHENTYRWQYGQDSGGTRMLADRLSSMIALRPDFICCAEWDEENENTCFRPTVSSATARCRLMRWFKAAMNPAVPLVPRQGDDTSVPNLVLSHRKSIVAGETLVAEVRNVPDGAFRGATFTLKLRWLDAGGNCVKEYPSAELAADEMKAVEFRTPVTELLEHRFLRPELTVETASGRQTFTDGLWPVDINALRTVEHAWVKEPLRDIASGVQGVLEVGEPDADGVRTVRGRVSAPRTLRSIEVLDDQDTVYLHSKEPEIPKDFERFRIEYSGSAHPLATASEFSGTVSAGGKEVVFRNCRCDRWGGIEYLNVPGEEIEKGELVVDLEPLFRGRVPLRELMNCEPWGLNSSNGCGIAVTRYFPPAAIPPPYNEREAEFCFRWKPLERNSVLRLQLVDGDYRVWRGAVRSVWKKSGREVRFPVFDRERGETVEAVADSSLVETLRADLAGTGSSVVRLGQGRSLAGMRGASAALSQNFGKGESNYGNPLNRPCAKKGFPPFPASGWGCLPLQVVPGFAGFTLELKVKPAGFGSRQGLFSSGNCGLEVTIDAEGAVAADFAAGVSFLRRRGPLAVTAKGPRLRDGEWNTVRIATDRRTAWIEVNGVRGEAVPYGDYFFNQRYGLFGAAHPVPDYFRGELGAFSVTY